MHRHPQRRNPPPARYDIRHVTWEPWTLVDTSGHQTTQAGFHHL